tara:strand:- start:1771 stop:2040 length:270 start_codon:yes stop_codon:yes gene_type:complete
MVSPSIFPMIPTVTIGILFCGAVTGVFQGVGVGTGVVVSTEPGLGARSLTAVHETSDTSAIRANNAAQPYINLEAATIFIISSGESLRQ